MRRRWVVGIGLLFVWVCAWMAYVSMQHQAIGLHVAINEQGQYEITHRLNPKFAEHRGISLGDIVLEIDGGEPGDHGNVRNWKTIDEAEQLLLSKPDGSGTFRVQFPKGGNWLTIDTYLLIGGLLLLGGALAAAKLLSGLRSNNSYILLLLNLAMICFVLGAAARGDMAARLIFMGALILTPLIFLYYLILFFQEKRNLPVSKAVIAYPRYLMIGIGIFGLLLLIPLFGVETAYGIYAMYFLVAVVVLVVGVIAVLGYLLLMYVRWRRKDTYFSILLKAIWISLMISVSPIWVLYLLPDLFWGNGWVNPVLLLYFLLFFPLSFIYFMASERIYDIDSLIRRVGFTALIALIPSALVVLVVYFILDRRTTAGELLIIFMFTVTVLCVVIYTLEYVTGKLEPWFFPRKYAFQQALKRVAANLQDISSFRELRESVLIHVVETLQVFGAAIVFRYEGRTEVICEGDIEDEQVAQMLDRDASYDEESFSLIEINRTSDYDSYLITTRKKTNTKLGLEESQWLELLISYLSVSVESIYLIRKLRNHLQEMASEGTSGQAKDRLMWFRKLMFDLQEEERVRIATDLHDTTMQELVFLKRRFEQEFRKYTTTEQAKNDFSSALRFIEIINMNLRQSCFELHPFLLDEIGLVQSLQMIVNQEAATGTSEIVFEYSDTEIIEQMASDTKRHVFRLIHDLLSIARKRSGITRIRIVIKMFRGDFIVSYGDDSPLPATTINADEDTQTSNLSYIKNRVNLLSGQLESFDLAQQGVNLSITIPVEKEMSA